MTKFCSYFQLGALEGQNAIKHNQRIGLSPQELIDCSRLYGNFGCGCGWVKYAFNYVIDKGISSALDYPYDFAEHLCNNLTEIPRVSLNVTSYTLVDATEEALRQAVGKISCYGKRLHIPLQICNYEYCSTIMGVLVNPGIVHYRLFIVCYIC